MNLSTQINSTVKGCQPSDSVTVKLDEMPAYALALSLGYDGLSEKLRVMFSNAEITAPQMACAAVSLAASRGNMEIFPAELPTWPKAAQRRHHADIAKHLERMGFGSLATLCRKDAVIFFDMIEGGWANVA